MTQKIEPPNYGNVPPGLVWVNNRRFNKVIRNQDRGVPRASKTDVLAPCWRRVSCTGVILRRGLSADVPLAPPIFLCEIQLWFRAKRSLV